MIPANVTSILKVIARSAMAQRVLDLCTVNRDHVGVLFVDGRYIETLAPGLYAFWKGQSEAKVVEIDLRETMVDLGGQEIMTANKVTLRLNAVVTYKIVDARKAAEANLISRREETAAMRSQANTAKLLADNPVLMLLAELEVLEKIASSGRLNIVLGEKTLGEKGLVD